MLNESEAWLWVAEQLAISNSTQSSGLFYFISELPFRFYVNMKSRFFSHVAMRETPTSLNDNDSAVIFAILMSIEASEEQ